MYDYLPLLKRCSRCKDFKRLDLFNKLSRSNDGRQHYCRACQKDERQAHATRYNAQWARWSRNNPASVKARSSRRRARLRNAGGSFTGWDWLRIVRQYQGRCVACLRLDPDLTADHVHPLATGGSNDASNIQPLCRGCNLSKYTKTVDYRPDFAARLVVYLSNDGMKRAVDIDPILTEIPLT